MSLEYTAIMENGDNLIIEEKFNEENFTLQNIIKTLSDKFTSQFKNYKLRYFNLFEDGLLEGKKISFETPYILLLFEDLTLANNNEIFKIELPNNLKGLKFNEL